jgi:hypothetical protein
MAKAVMSPVVGHNAVFALATHLATIHIRSMSCCCENTRQQKGEHEAFHLGLHSCILSGERQEQG